MNDFTESFQLGMACGAFAAVVIMALIAIVVLPDLRIRALRR